MHPSHQGDLSIPMANIWNMICQEFALRLEMGLRVIDVILGPATGGQVSRENRSSGCTWWGCMNVLKFLIHLPKWAHIPCLKNLGT